MSSTNIPKKFCFEHRPWRNPWANRLLGHPVHKPISNVVTGSDPASSIERLRAKWQLEFERWRSRLVQLCIPSRAPSLRWCGHCSPSSPPSKNSGLKFGLEHRV
jgi:hypothetical protein